MALLIGYAQQNITPSLDQPIFLAGLGQNRRVESNNGSLSAHGKALMTPSQRFALVSCDFIGLEEAFTNPLDPCRDRSS